MKVLKLELLKNGRFWAALFVILILGIFLRFYQLESQILLDDEWHGLTIVSQKSFTEILGLTSSGATSALSNLYDWLLLHTLGWSETLLRLPQIFAGLSALLLFTFFIRKHFDRITTLCFAFMMAVSPFLIFYSRNKRPYSLVLLLGFTALIYFYQWVLSGHKKERNLYIIFASLAGFFHPAPMAAALAPLLLMMFIKIMKINAVWAKTLTFHDFLKAGTCLLGLWALFYIPVLLKNAWIIKELSRLSPLTWETLAGMAILMSGIAQPPLILIYALLILGGAKRLLHDNPLLGWIFCSAYFASVALFTVYCQQIPLVVTRYLICLFPIHFVFIAYALQFLIKISSGWLRLFTIFSVLAFLGSLCFYNPLTRHYFRRPNNFMMHSAFQENYQSKKWRDHSYQSDVLGDYAMAKQHVPAYYFELPKDRSVQTILEYPMLVGDAYNLFYYYQYFHRKRVFIGYWPHLNQPENFQRTYARAHESIDISLSLIANPRKLHFSNMISMLDFKAIQKAAIDRIILHPKIFQEMQPRNLQSAKTSHDPSHYLETLYTKILGAPAYKGEGIIVYEIGRNQLAQAVNKKYFE